MKTLKQFINETLDWSNTNQGKYGWKQSDHSKDPKGRTTFYFLL